MSSTKSGRLPLRLGAVRTAAMASLLLAACAPGIPDPAPRSDMHASLMAHENLHLVFFASDQATVDGAERQRLLSFLSSLPEDGRTTLDVVGHADERASYAYNQALGAERARRVADLILATGIPVGDVTTRSMGETDQLEPGSSRASLARNRRVEVQATTYGIGPTSCNYWSSPTEVPPYDHELQGLGCATDSNLLLMLADPRDLDQPRQLGPADGEAQGNAVARYRADKTKPLIEGTVQP